MKKGLALGMALALMLTLPLSAAPYDTYTYVNASDGIYDVSAPAAYIPGVTLTATELGVEMEQPEDLYCDREGNFYIVDTGASAVHAFSPEWKLRFTLATFAKGEEEDSLYAPEGVCVDFEGRVWVADTGNHRLVCFDAAGNYVLEVGTPTSALLDEDFVFSPIKLAVDEVGRIFTVCRNVFDGLVQVTTEEKFVGYVGSNYAVGNWYEQIWQSIMTDIQIEQRLDFIPMEYANICLDDEGFLYVTTAVSEVENPIRRLNSSGEDVMVRKAINGIAKVAGDVMAPADSPSSMVDVAAGKMGIFYALDGTRGRIFAYDEDGNMLFEFGGINTYQQGTFIQPSSLAVRENTIYVLDREKRAVVEFLPTDYATNMYAALSTYRSSHYEDSLQIWQTVLKQNSNFDLAYAKAGFCLYRMKDYQKAMEYFSIANDRDSYSMAMAKYRNQWLNDHFVLCAAVLVGVVALGVGTGVLVYRRRRRKQKEGGMQR